MNDAYILELVFTENGLDHYYYFEHNMYHLQDYPTHRSLMELTPARAKRTKILKEHEMGYWKGLKEVKIIKATIQLKETVESISC